jgi:hypothetical protein
MSSPNCSCSKQTDRNIKALKIRFSNATSVVFMQPIPSAFNGNGLINSTSQFVTRFLQEVQNKKLWEDLMTLTSLQISVVRVMLNSANYFCRGATYRIFQFYSCRHELTSYTLLSWNNKLLKYFTECCILKLRKIKLSLCLTKHHAMKMYWGVEVL